MTQKFNRILLVSDGSDAAKAAERSALNLALRDGSKVIICDTIRLQGVVEKWLVRNSEEMYHSFEHEKTAKLEKLAEEFRSKGCQDVSIKLLHGKSSERLAETVKEEKCDLLVRYRKGTFSRHIGLFGRTAINLLRICPCPILLVAENHEIRDPKVLACVDIAHEDSVNEQIIQAARRLNAGHFGVLYCWAIFGHQMIRHRMTQQEYERLFEDVKRQRSAEFDEFLVKFGIDRTSPDVAMKFGNAEQIIAPYVKINEIDVTVMATTKTAGLSDRLLGSTIENIVGDLPNNLLAVKPGTSAD